MSVEVGLAKFDALEPASEVCLSPFRSTALLFEEFARQERGQTWQRLHTTRVLPYAAVKQVRPILEPVESCHQSIQSTVRYAAAY